MCPAVLGEQLQRCDRRGSELHQEHAAVATQQALRGRQEQGAQREDRHHRLSRIFNGEDCNAGTYFSPAEEERLNATADLLDTTIRGRADAYRFSFADPRSSFAGHAVCDTTEWVNGLSNPVSESYHPNRGGQAGYANLVDNYLT